MGEISHFTFYNFRRLLTSPRFYITLLIIYCCMWMCFGQVSSALAENGQTLQAAELFIFASCSRIPQWILAFGMLLLLADVPFIHEGLSVHLIRSTRFRWLMGQLIFCAITVICYLLLVEVMLITLSGKHMTFTNAWSDIIQIVVRLPSSVNGKQLNIDTMMEFPLEIVLAASPWAIFALSFFYDFLLLMLFCFICLVCNTRWRTGLGCLVVVVLLMLRYLIDNRLLPFSSLIAMISPCSMAAPQNRSINALNIIYTVAFFLCVSGFLAMWGYQIVQHADLDKGANS